MSRLLILLAGLTAFSANAADWVKIHSGADQSQYFYDRSKLFIQTNEITYWRKVVFNPPQVFNDRLVASGLYRERIQCDEHNLQLISYLLYSPTGEVLEYAPTKDGEAAPIIPDSLGDVFEKALCPMVRQEQARTKARNEAEAKARIEAESKANSAATPGGNDIAPAAPIIEIPIPPAPPQPPVVVPR